jgi:NADPH-dependent 7-cyano-7-deazaguanine reductase QueF-like protein
MTRLYLGKNTSKSNRNNKIKLDRIERKKSSIKYGIDIWNSYEFFYLNEKGEPESSILEIIIRMLV